MNKNSIFSIKNSYKLSLALLCTIIFATEFAQCMVNDFQPMEEEIGAVTHGTLVNPDVYAHALSKYDNLDLWISVLDTSIRINMYESRTDPYTNILEESLGINNFNDFNIAFNQKMDDFKQFSINYLAKDITPINQTFWEKYKTKRKYFCCLLQKKALPEDYNIIQVGDLHGDLIALLTILKHLEPSLNKDFSLKDDNQFLVFTGDYIDRGQFGLEILYILMSLKIKNPDNIFFLLGNHEAEHKYMIGYNQGFAQEIRRKFGFEEINFTTRHKIIGPGAKACKKFMHNLEQNIFKYLPSAIFMKTELGFIMFCHGIPDTENADIPDFLDVDKLSIFFITKHPSEIPFSNGYLTLLEKTDRNASCDKLLTTIGQYMINNNIFLCGGAHQHNLTINAPFKIEDGGVVMRNAPPKGLITTTSSFDCACCIPQIIGIGSYAHFFQIDKTGLNLTIKNMAIDRNFGTEATLIDRNRNLYTIQLAQ